MDLGVMLYQQKNFLLKRKQHNTAYESILYTPVKIKSLAINSFCRCLNVLLKTC
jgi:hypothetical protein